jgi:hypothetical protein
MFSSLCPHEEDDAIVQSQNKVFKVTSSSIHIVLPPTYSEPSANFAVHKTKSHKMTFSLRDEEVFSDSKYESAVG